jgi:hypothetical protein
MLGDLNLEQVSRLAQESDFTRGAFTVETRQR